MNASSPLASRPGIETKTLLVERKSGLLTLLMKMAPGARLPGRTAACS